MSIVKQTIELFKNVEEIISVAGDDINLLLVANDYESAIFKNFKGMSKSELEEYKKGIKN